MPIGDFIPADDTTTEMLILDGTPFTGFLEEEGDHDWIKVVISDGGVYSFALEVEDGIANNASLQLMDASGNQIAQDNAIGAVIEIKVAPGTYYLNVSSGSGTTGNYSLSGTIVFINAGPYISGQAPLTAGYVDKPYTVTEAALLNGISDSDNDSLSVSNLAADYGTVNDNGDGTYTITPTVGFHGIMSLTYTVSDGFGGTAEAAQSVRMEQVVFEPGVETQVNTFMTGEQVGVSVAHLTGGGYIIVWNSIGQDGAGYGDYGQLYNANGSKQGNEIHLNASASGDQLISGVSGLANGGFIVTWQGPDAGNLGISARRFDAAGDAIEDDTIVNTVTVQNQLSPHVGTLSSGEYIVTWMSEFQDGSLWGIYAARYSAAGIKQGGDFLVNTTTAGNQQGSSITALAGGGFVISWSSTPTDGSSWGVYTKVYDATAEGVVGETRVNTTTVDTQNGARVAALSDGGYVVVWQSNGQDGSGNGVYAQRYDASGATVGTETQINTTTLDEQSGPTVSALADGGYVIVWNSYLQDDSDYGIFAQRYDIGGVAVGGEFLVTTATQGAQSGPSVTSLTNGDLVFAWTGQDDDMTGIYQKVFSINAIPVLTGNYTVPTDGTEDTAYVVNLAQLIEGYTDGDGDILSVGTLTADHGTVVAGDGIWTITPTANYNGPVTLTYTIEDGHTGSVAETRTFSLGAVNDAPTWSGPLTLAGVNEGTNAVFTVEGLLVNATDVDGDILSIDGGKISVLNTKGFSIGSAAYDDGEFTITLSNENYNGQVRLNYNITDGKDVVAGTASYFVAGVNDEVTGTAAVIADIDEDSPFSLTNAQLLANISDIEDMDDNLSISIGAVTGGSFVYNAETQGYDFTPTSNYHGPASITYTVSDTDGDHHEVTSSFNIASVNDTPTGEAIVIAATEDSVFSLTRSDLLANISDIEDANLDLTISIGAVVGGTLVFNVVSGKYDFAATPNFNGPASITYTVTDTNEGSQEFTSNFTIQAVNDAPILTGTPAPLGGGLEDISYVVSLALLLDGYTDVDLDALSVGTVTADHGLVTFVPGGQYFQITPDANYHGIVTLSYNVLDGNNGSVAATRTFSLASVNDAGPALTGEQADLDFGTMDKSYTLTAQDLLQGFSDIDGDELSISGAVTADHGAVVYIGEGEYTFTPTEGYIGRVTFSFAVSDGIADAVPATNQTFVLSDTDLLTTSYTPQSQIGINSATTGEQNASAVAHLTGGGYVVTWVGTDLVGSTASIGIKARFVGADGSPTGEFQVNTTTVQTQYQPTITGLANGGYAIAWSSNLQDGSSYGVYVKQYAADGTLAHAETKVNTHTGSEQHQPTITAFSDGSYMVSWASSSINTGDGSSYGIAAQRFNAGGSASGTEFLINTYTAGDQQSPAITALADNSFVVTWHSTGQEGSGLGYGIYAQRYNAAGVAQGGEVHVNTSTAGNQRFPATAALEDGGYVIAWQDSATTDVHFQRYNASGVAQGSQTLANSGATSLSQTDVAIAALSTGGFVIVWTSSADSDGSGIFAQRFTATGDADGDIVRINTTTTGDQLAASVTTLTNGSFVVSWTSPDASGNGIFHKVIEANTQPYLGDAQADLTSGSEDTPFTVSTATLLQGVMDGEGHDLTVTSLTGDNFTAVYDPMNAVWTITPSANFSGTLTLNYAVSDGHNGTLNLTQTVDVTAVNDAPAIGDSLDTTATEGGTNVIIDALSNVSDLEDNDLTIIPEETLPAGVTFVGSSFTFDPTNSAYDSLAFGQTTDIVINYEISDGTTTTDASITITVTGTNDAPDITISGDTTGTVTEDEGPFEGLPGAITGGLTNGPVNDPVGDTLAVSGELDFGDVDLNDSHTITVTPGYLFLSLTNYVGDLTATVSTDSTGTGNGTLSWTFTVANEDVQFLAAGQIQTQQYAITVNDGHDGMDTEIVTVTITGTNDQPLLSGTQAALEDGTEDQTYTVSAADLLSGFSDVDTQDDLLVANLSASNGATVLDNDNGTYTITHASNFNGTITLSYNVVDGKSGSVAATQSYTVEAVNDAPLAGYDSVGNTTPEETVVTYDVSDLISDVDLDNLDGLTITAQVDSDQGTVSVEGKIITFTPATNFVGSAIISYTVSDGTLSSTGEVWYNVTNVNDAPTAENDTVSGTEETLQVINVLDLIGDVDAGEILTVTAATSPNGSVTINGTQLSFTPASNFYGAATITYTVSDGETSTDGTITVNVANTYDAPTTNPDGGEIDDMLEDTTINLTVADFLTGVLNPDNATLTASDVFASEGVITQTTPGNYRYTPPADYYGEVTINFTLSDGTTSVISEIKFNVVNVNDAPIAPVNPATLGTTDEDVAFTGSDATLLADWFDVDFERDEDGVLPDLVVSNISVSGGGQVIRDDGSFTITMPQDFNGTATITYTVFDGVEYVDSTRTLTVTPVADAPVIDEDAAVELSGTEDIALGITAAQLLQGISDPDGGSSLTITAISASVGVITSTDGNLTFTYTPAADDNGEVVITYTVSDGVDSTQFTNTFQLAAVNDAPRGFAAGIGGFVEDTVRSIPLGNLLTAIQDVDSNYNDLSVTAISATHGTITLNSVSGLYDFTPDANYTGPASITYTVSDGQASTQYVSEITIDAVNDAPAGTAATITGVTEDLTSSFSRAQLLADITDVDNTSGQLSVTAVSATHGTFALNIDTGNYDFRPTANYTGSASITYSVFDGTTSIEYTSIFTVANVNDDPTAPATIDLGLAAEDSTITVDVADLLAGWTDIDGDAQFTVSNLSAGDGFTVTLSEDETYYTVTTPADFVGEIVFEYEVSDGNGGSSAGGATLLITNVYDSPELDVPATLTAIDEDTTTTVSTADLLQGWSSVEDVNLAVSMVTATHATVVNNSGIYTLTPDANFHGTVTINYVVSDGWGQPIAASLDLTVNSVIDVVTSDTTTTLGATDEKLVLTGEDDIDGTGNSLNNELVGNDGANKLDGKAGADTMYGGGNDDIYIVDNIGDVASEESLPGLNDGGFDIVRSSVSYTLGNYIEVLRLTGSGNTNATGNSQSNFLYGNSGNNALDGSYGGDIMEGGLGNDTYYVNVATDEVVEAFNAGIDTVVSQISYTLSDNLENVTLASWGTAAINATGNGLANVVTGGRGSNVLSGMAGDDTIAGDAGNDTIDGGLGADVMYGGAGSDNYYINDIGDTVSEETVTGVNDGGIDTVFASVSHTLGNFFERLTLEGSGGITGIGNGQNNLIIGNSGNNVLDGGAGADTITGGDGIDFLYGGTGNDLLDGGAGTDAFYGGTGNDTMTGGAGGDAFNLTRVSNGTDRITDFESGSDHLAFIASDFGYNGGHTLQPGQLSNTGVAVGSSAQFVFNGTTHALYWDANGSSSGGLTLLTYLDNVTALTTSDFYFSAPV